MYKYVCAQLIMMVRLRREDLLGNEELKLWEKVILPGNTYFALCDSNFYFQWNVTHDF
jgi:hypothetical protein